jgi:anti-sigma factor RsiW
MNRATEIELMRLLHGELPAEQARALRARLDREPELAAAWERLERTWSGLELPPAAPAPPAFAQRVLAEARRQSGPAGRLSWALAPRWARATAAAAVAAGIALGIGAGSWVTRWQEPDTTLSVSATGAGPSLAETYWDCLGELDGDGARL